jgi:hypothetical protein
MLGRLISGFEDTGKSYAGVLASKPSSEIDSTQSKEDIM